MSVCQLVLRPAVYSVAAADGSHAPEYWRRAYGILKRLDPGLELQPAPPRRVREAYLALLESLAFEPGTTTAANHFAIEAKLPQVRVPTLVMCSDTDWNLPHHATIVDALLDARPLRLAGVHPLHELGRPDRAANTSTTSIDSSAAFPSVPPRAEPERHRPENSMTATTNVKIQGPAGRLSVRARGLDTRPRHVVILVQGANMSGQMGYDFSAPGLEDYSMMDALVRAGFGAITFSVRGYAGSDAPADPLTVYLQGGWDRLDFFKTLATEDKAFVLIPGGGDYAHLQNPRRRIVQVAIDFLR
jgi:hypothetical protein